MSLRGIANRLSFSLTVIRLEGMRLMRPEVLETWRLIVTVEIDEHNTRETILGVDGQSIVIRRKCSTCAYYYFPSFFFFYAYFAIILFLNSLLQ